MDTGEEETSEDIATHLIDKRENYLKAMRTYKWRETKFERWIKTAESMVALKKDAGATEAIIWQWLLDMLKTLGEDGMSSEESDNETNDSIHSVLRPKNLPWRRNIEEELKTWMINDILIGTYLLLKVPNQCSEYAVLGIHRPIENPPLDCPRYFTTRSGLAIKQRIMSRKP
ncbi:hypothetical protein K439DRAFT_1622493 [Ramaria rubella]|nr:hypothetical protein K439DRAFT_1622493 [Ramaria rubella]